MGNPLFGVELCIKILKLSCRGSYVITFFTYQFTVVLSLFAYALLNGIDPDFGACGKVCAVYQVGNLKFISQMGTDYAGKTRTLGFYQRQRKAFIY